MISFAFSTVGMSLLQPLLRGDVIMSVPPWKLDALSGHLDQLERRMSGKNSQEKEGCWPFNERTSQGHLEF